MLLLGRRRSTRIKTAPMTREIRVASAAPAAPIWKPKMNRAFPPMLIKFITMEIIIEIFELPIARNKAAPALYRAMKG